VNEKTSNKHRGIAFDHAQTFTFDDEKNDWIGDDYHNFYFFEGEDAKVIYYCYENGESQSEQEE
jgi:hypothetical protein